MASASSLPAALGKKKRQSPAASSEKKDETVGPVKTRFLPEGVRETKRVIPISNVKSLLKRVMIEKTEEIKLGSHTFEMLYIGLIHYLRRLTLVAKKRVTYRKNVYENKGDRKNGKKPSGVEERQRVLNLSVVEDVFEEASLLGKSRGKRLLQTVSEKDIENYLLSQSAELDKATVAVPSSNRTEAVSAKPQ